MRYLVCLTLSTLSLFAQPNQFTTLEVIPRTNNASTGELRFRQLRPTNRYVGFKAPTAIGASLIWTLPSADSSGCFQSNGSGTLSIGTCGGIPFSDASYQLYNSSDSSKRVLFDASGITAATTRTLTMPNASTTLAGLGLAQTFTATNTFHDIAFSASDTYNIGASGTRVQSYYGRTVDLTSTATPTTAQFYVRRASNAGLISAIDNGSSQMEFLVSNNSVEKFFVGESAARFSTTLAVTNTITSYGIVPATSATYNIGASSSSKYEGVYARFANLYATDSSHPGGVFMRTSGSNLRASFSADDSTGGEFSLIDGSGNQFFSATNGVLRFGSGATAGANVTLSCGAGQAVKTLTTVQGGVTAATCGAP